MQKIKEEVIFIHMLNNFSGSPNVLSTVAEQLYKKNIKTTILTSFNNDGFLSKTPSEKKINVSYTFQRNLILRACELIKFQILSAWIILKLSKDKIIYINTILPFLPALAAKIKGNKIIYHIHEAYPKKSLFQKKCFWVAENCSDKIICVSEFVKDNLNVVGKEKALVVYNSLSDSFITKIKKRVIVEKKTVLMISSARAYKGIFEFCRLAKEMPHHNFVLVCDTTQEEIYNIFDTIYLNLKNLNIYPSQLNLHEFYSTSDLILNLSNPQLIIETFGLTILEGMYYGLPSIVPPIGGIAEIVHENGLKIDVNNFEKLKSGIDEILFDDVKYRQMSENAIKMAERFNKDLQTDKILKIIFSE